MKNFLKICSRLIGHLHPKCLPVGDPPSTYSTILTPRPPVSRGERMLPTSPPGNATPRRVPIIGTPTLCSTAKIKTYRKMLQVKHK